MHLSLNTAARWAMEARRYTARLVAKRVLLKRRRLRTRLFQRVLLNYASGAIQQTGFKRSQGS